MAPRAGALPACCRAGRCGCQERSRMGPRDALGRLPLFSVLRPGWLEGWLAAGVGPHVDICETLLVAGTPGQHVYVVQQGRVRVMRVDKSGREVSLGALAPGDVF